ncbi:MAG TPA: PP0621 family protein [bacterium]|nr:PP0621 family protein [bacterium]
MARLLLTALLIYFAYRYFSRNRQFKRGHTARQSRSVGGEMVPCARCGTFVVAVEATNKGGALFCSEKCKNK